MQTWDHLPNALQIERILSDVKARPEVWAVVHKRYANVWLEAHRDAATAAYTAGRTKDTIHAHNIALTMAHAAVSPGESNGVWVTIQSATRAALVTLIAWDSSADLLALTPDALRTIIATCDGDVKHQAVLLLPAVIALSTP